MYKPSDLLIEAISLCSTGINFGHTGPAVVLILLKQTFLPMKTLNLFFTAKQECRQNPYTPTYFSTKTRLPHSIVHKQFIFLNSV